MKYALITSTLLALASQTAAGAPPPAGQKYCAEGAAVFLLLKRDEWSAALTSACKPGDLVLIPMSAGATIARHCVLADTVALTDSVICPLRATPLENRQ